MRAEGSVRGVYVWMFRYLPQVCYLKTNWMNAYLREENRNKHQRNSLNIAQIVFPFNYPVN